MSIKSQFQNKKESKGLVQEWCGYKTVNLESLPLPKTQNSNFFDFFYEINGQYVICRAYKTRNSKNVSRKTKINFSSNFIRKIFYG